VPKKGYNPRQFGLSASSVGAKLKLMFVGECSTMPCFERVRRCTSDDPNKTEVGVEAARLSGAQLKMRRFVACFLHRA